MAGKCRLDLIEETPHLENPETPLLGKRGKSI